MYEGSATMENPPSYLKGDIVWVKLSGYWWPGEVVPQEELPSDLLADFKKPPLVIAKFFEEDSYEYIKHWSNIYPYNCDKKTEFIKKGMAGFRAKLPHMAKFPKDIGMAEERTDGNPDILSEPAFLPPKKLNLDEIFGSPSPKKSQKSKVVQSTPRKSIPKDNNGAVITHRRFLGNDDYKAYVFIQYPCKDRPYDSDEEEIKKLNAEPQELLTCQACPFTTYRLGVLLMHSQTHSDGALSTYRRKSKKPRDILDKSDPETEAPVVKSPKPKQPRKKKELIPSKPLDVFTDLLEEWSDDEEMDMNSTSVQEEQLGSDISKEKLESEVEEGRSAQESPKEKTTTNHVIPSTPDTPKYSLSSKNTQEDIKNCFDFDEEDEEEDFLLPTSAGRKIPRVIPEKPRASISELLEQSEKDEKHEDVITKEPDSKEAEGNKKEILDSNQSLNNKQIIDDSLEHTFKALMEETEVPLLDDLSEALKPEQNFHDARTIKFPDKGGTTTPKGGGTIMKVATPKKKFVTSFEDFETGFRKITDDEQLKAILESEDKMDEFLTDDYTTERVNEVVNQVSSETTDQKRKLLVVEDRGQIIEYELEVEQEPSGESTISNKKDLLKAVKSLEDPDISSHHKTRRRGKDVTKEAQKVEWDQSSGERDKSSSLISSQTTVIKNLRKQDIKGPKNYKTGNQRSDNTDLIQEKNLNILEEPVVTTADPTSFAAMANSSKLRRGGSRKIKKNEKTVPEEPHKKLEETVIETGKVEDDSGEQLSLPIKDTEKVTTDDTLVESIEIVEHEKVTTNDTLVESIEIVQHEETDSDSRIQFGNSTNDDSVPGENIDVEPTSKTEKIESITNRTGEHQSVDQEETEDYNSKESSLKSKRVKPSISNKNKRAKVDSSKKDEAVKNEGELIKDVTDVPESSKKETEDVNIENVSVGVNEEVKLISPHEPIEGSESSKHGSNETRKSSKSEITPESIEGNVPSVLEKPDTEKSIESKVRRGRSRRTTNSDCVTKEQSEIPSQLHEPKHVAQHSEEPLLRSRKSMSKKTVQSENNEVHNTTAEGTVQPVCTEHTCSIPKRLSLRKVMKTEDPVETAHKSDENTKCEISLTDSVEPKEMKEQRSYRSRLRKSAIAEKNEIDSPSEIVQSKAAELSKIEKAQTATKCEENKHIDHSFPTPENIDKLISHNEKSALIEVNDIGCEETIEAGVIITTDISNHDIMEAKLSEPNKVSENESLKPRKSRSSKSSKSEHPALIEEVIPEIPIGDKIDTKIAQINEEQTTRFSDSQSQESSETKQPSPSEVAEVLDADVPQAIQGQTSISTSSNSRKILKNEEPVSSVEIIPEIPDENLTQVSGEQIPPLSRDKSKENSNKEDTVLTENMSETLTQVSEEIVSKTRSESVKHTKNESQSLDEDRIRDENLIQLSAEQSLRSCRGRSRTFPKNEDTILPENTEISSEGLTQLNEDQTPRSRRAKSRNISKNEDVTPTEENTSEIADKTLVRKEQSSKSSKGKSRPKTTNEKSMLSEAEIVTESLVQSNQEQTSRSSRSKSRDIAKNDDLAPTVDIVPDIPSDNLKEDIEARTTRLSKSQSKKISKSEVPVETEESMSADSEPTVDIHPDISNDNLIEDSEAKTSRLSKNQFKKTSKTEVPITTEESISDDSAPIGDIVSEIPIDNLTEGSEGQTSRLTKNLSKKISKTEVPVATEESASRVSKENEMEMTSIELGEHQSSRFSRSKSKKEAEIEEKALDEAVVLVTSALPTCETFEDKPGLRKSKHRRMTKIEKCDADAHGEQIEQSKTTEEPIEELPRYRKTKSRSSRIGEIFNETMNQQTEVPRETIEERVKSRRGRSRRSTEKELSEKIEEIQTVIDEHAKSTKKEEKIDENIQGPFDAVMKEIEEPRETIEERVKSRRARTRRSTDDIIPITPEKIEETESTSDVHTKSKKDYSKIVRSTINKLTEEIEIPRETIEERVKSRKGRTRKSGRIEEILPFSRPEVVGEILETDTKSKKGHDMSEVFLDKIGEALETRTKSKKGKFTFSSKTRETPSLTSYEDSSESTSEKDDKLGSLETEDSNNKTEEPLEMEIESSRKKIHSLPEVCGEDLSAKSSENKYKIEPSSSSEIDADNIKEKIGGPSETKTETGDEVGNKLLSSLSSGIDRKIHEPLEAKKKTRKGRSRADLKTEEILPICSSGSIIATPENKNTVSPNDQLTSMTSVTDRDTTRKMDETSENVAFAEASSIGSYEVLSEEKINEHSGSKTRSKKLKSKLSSEIGKKLQVSSTELIVEDVDRKIEDSAEIQEKLEQKITGGETEETLLSGSSEAVTEGFNEKNKEPLKSEKVDRKKRLRLSEKSEGTLLSSSLEITAGDLSERQSARDRLDSKISEILPITSSAKPSEIEKISGEVILEFHNKYEDKTMDSSDDTGGFNEKNKQDFKSDTCYMEGREDKSEETLPSRSSEFVGEDTSEKSIEFSETSGSSEHAALPVQVFDLITSQPIATGVEFKQSDDIKSESVKATEENISALESQEPSTRKSKRGKSRWYTTETVETDSSLDKVVAREATVEIDASDSNSKNEEIQLPTEEYVSNSSEVDAKESVTFDYLSEIDVSQIPLPEETLPKASNSLSVSKEVAINTSKPISSNPTVVPLSVFDAFTEKCETEKSSLQYDIWPESNKFPKEERTEELVVASSQKKSEISPITGIVCDRIYSKKSMDNQTSKSKPNRSRWDVVSRQRDEETIKMEKPVEVISSVVSIHSPNHQSPVGTERTGISESQRENRKVKSSRKRRRSRKSSSPQPEESDIKKIASLEPIPLPLESHSAVEESKKEKISSIEPISLPLEIQSVVEDTKEDGYSKQSTNNVEDQNLLEKQFHNTEEVHLESSASPTEETHTPDFLGKDVGISKEDSKLEVDTALMDTKVSEESEISSMEHSADQSDTALVDTKVSEDSEISSMEHSADQSDTALVDTKVSEESEISSMEHSADESDTALVDTKVPEDPEISSMEHSADQLQTLSPQVTNKFSSAEPEALVPTEALSLIEKSTQDQDTWKPSTHKSSDDFEDSTVSVPIQAEELNLDEHHVLNDTKVKPEVSLALIESEPSKTPSEQIVGSISADFKAKELAPVDECSPLDFSMINLDKESNSQTSNQSSSEDIAARTSIGETEKPVPPKKSRWSRCGIYPTKVNTVEQQLETPVSKPVIEKTDIFSLETAPSDNSNSSFNENELILPLKKSKRVNEANSQMIPVDQPLPEKKSDDSLNFPACDDSFMSTSLRNNIEGLIKEIEIENSFDPPSSTPEATLGESTVASREDLDLSRSVPPKKKKIELKKEDEPKLDDSIPRPPKKKIQKLFETSQAIEKADKIIDLPLMSPLAKKKSFLFNQEEFNQSPSEKHKDSTELALKQLLNSPKIGKKRKSTSSEECPLKKEKLEQIMSSGEVAVKSDETKESANEIDDKKDIVVPGLVPNEPELVSIAVPPTVISEVDLVDTQVEITTDKVINEKKPTAATTLGTFSMDFQDAPKPSTNSETSGTEFTSKAMVKEFDNRPLISQPNTYALKSELLDILEGNSNSSTNSSGSEQKFKTSFDNYDKKSTVQGIIDFEDAIPSQIVLSNKVSAESVLMDSPKLLERLSMANEPAKAKTQVLIQTDVKVPENVSKPLISKLSKPGGIPKPGQKIVIKTQWAQPKSTATTKSVILSDKVIRHAPQTTTASVKTTVQGQGVKRQYEDVEDVQAVFIIPKVAKKVEEEEVVAAPPVPEKPVKVRGSKTCGKAKILQQTIITAKGEVIPQSPTTTATPTTASIQLRVQSGQDDSVFDINSMPIVLSDDLTPESIQNMPVVLSEDVPHGSVPTTQVSAAKKIVAGLTGTKQVIFKTTQPVSTTTGTPKHVAKGRILATQTKLPKPGTTALLATGTTADGKPTKYVLVPPSVTSTAPQVKSIKQAVVKKSPQSPVPPVTVPSGADQLVGNKIMIVTNAQGQQTRVVLTPQQQKVFMQAQTASKKAIIKGAIPKALLESATPGPSGVVKTVASVTQGAAQIISGTAPTVSSHSGLLMPAVKSTKPSVPIPKKGIPRSVTSKQQKTILIKNQLGQTVRKIQGTDDADLDRQVAEQLQAIKASARLQQTNKTPEVINFTNRQVQSISANKTIAIRKTIPKKVEPTKSRIPISASAELQKQSEGQKSADGSVPALAALSSQPRIPQVTQSAQSALRPITANKPVETVAKSVEQQQQPIIPGKEAENKRPDSPLRQVVIQDGLGNLTTVTVGQILAIPSETVDGQPQSYMLVTVDESGNLTPLNNDALMSLDPSLGAGGDVNNMVLQVDQGQGIVAAIKPSDPPVEGKRKVEERLKVEEAKHQIVREVPVPEAPKPAEVPLAVEQQIVIGEGVLPGDAGGQQLIVTGDPVATQKFLESLSDGSTDLANILANAEGGSVLLQADGQQILIRTNSTAGQAMLGIPERTEGSGNPLFGGHKPNQDILAAALANTDVFQPSDSQGSHSSMKSLPSSQLSPGSGGLYPMHVGNVLETSLTLSSPIMTPLEVPSTNSKKIDDEADILSQVPKNVDLPITITDPNIAQTVAHQQAASLMELTLPISETGPSTEMSSPSFSYSLPNIEDSVGSISQKTFSSSMPLLTEDVVEGENSTSSDSDRVRMRKVLETSPRSFSPNFSALPLLSDPVESTREEIVKSSNFEDIGSMPMISDDVIEDSGSSIGSGKPPRSSPKPVERDIVDEGLSTLGGEMCSSLSEPPPDMFDLSALTASQKEDVSIDGSSLQEPATPLSVHSDNSGEIPLQPPIVANLSDLKRSGDDSEGSDEKRPRFD